MHAIEGAGNIPAFLTKLWRLVDDEDTDDLISWTEGGNSFIIQNQALFARELLPRFYKHNNLASFIRQLNMYGFHKVVSADSGGLRVEKDEMEFAHPHFQQGREELIENIKRKPQRRIPSDGMDFSQIPVSRGAVEDNKKLSKLLIDVRDMKRDHDSMSTRLSSLKRENEVLWREYANIRQKFSKQEQIIEKLIHFLIAMVKTPSKPIIPKRKFGHLALEGGDEGPSMSSLPQLSQNVDILDNLTGGKINSGLASGSTGGAKIHEVTDLIDTDGAAASDPLANIFTPESSSNELHMEEVPVMQPDATIAGTITTNLEPGTILMVEGEPYTVQGSVPMASTSATISPVKVAPISIMSPNGSNLKQETPNAKISAFNKMLDGSSLKQETQNAKIAAYNRMLDEAPLSPELLETVDPSAVTQSFKYAASPTITQTPIVISTGTTKSTSPSKVQVSSKSKSPQVTVSTGKGKLKDFKRQKVTTSQPSMSVAVPEKTTNVQFSDLSELADQAQLCKDSVPSWSNTDISQQGELCNQGTMDSQWVTRNDLHNHMDEMQTSLDSLQDLMSSGNFSVDPSVLLSMFGSDDNLPDLDSIATNSGTSSGNEVSLYNPSFLDFTDMTAADDDDPLAEFLEKQSFASTSSGASSMPSGSAISKKTKGQDVDTSNGSSTTNICVEGEYVEHKLEDEHVGQKLEDEYVEHKLEDEYVELKLEKAQILENPQKQHKMEAEYVEHKLEDEYVEHKLEDDHVEQKLEDDHVELKLEKAQVLENPQKQHKTETELLWRNW